MIDLNEYFKIDIEPYLKDAKYPEDLAHEYADSLVPIYTADIRQEWLDLPEDNKNRFTEIGSLKERGDETTIEDLMVADIYLYLWNELSSLVAQWVDAQDGVEAGA